MRKGRSPIRAMKHAANEFFETCNSNRSTAIPTSCDTIDASVVDWSLPYRLYVPGNLQDGPQPALYVQNIQGRMDCKSFQHRAGHSILYNEGYVKSDSWRIDKAIEASTLNNDSTTSLNHSLWWLGDGGQPCMNNTEKPEVPSPTQLSLGSTTYSSNSPFLSNEIPWLETLTGQPPIDADGGSGQANYMIQSVNPITHRNNLSLCSNCNSCFPSPSMEKPMRGYNKKKEHSYQDLMLSRSCIYPKGDLASSNFESWSRNLDQEFIGKGNVRSSQTEYKPRLVESTTHPNTILSSPRFPLRPLIFSEESQEGAQPKAGSVDQTLNSIESAAQSKINPLVVSWNHNLWSQDSYKQHILQPCNNVNENLEQTEDYSGHTSVSTGLTTHLSNNISLSHSALWPQSLDKTHASNNSQDVEKKLEEVNQAPLPLKMHTWPSDIPSYLCNDLAHFNNAPIVSKGVHTITSQPPPPPTIPLIRPVSSPQKTISLLGLLHTSGWKISPLSTKVIKGGKTNKKRQDWRLSKLFEFSSDKAGWQLVMALVKRVGDLAAQHDHYPEILVNSPSSRKDKDEHTERWTVSIATCTHKPSAQQLNEEERSKKSIVGRIEAKNKINEL
ncbi:uncharacterized protein L203_101291 [Cryptococcus depauperatus CBS 7841]|uniref:Uncharacterized protein n=1 Tax=Cryptococcus depauperatus CBS 7841 TaxID=1295531 RepID=A0AAJ8LYX8_9TREE